MTLHFYEPPPARRTGGLDLAVRSLQGFLESRNVRVRTNTDPEQLACDHRGEIVHFHGLWQPRFLNVSKTCRRAGIPYLVSPHGMLEPWAWRHKFWKKVPYYYFFERSQLLNAAVVLATSEQEGRHLSRFSPYDRIKIIPLGLSDGPGPDYTGAREQLGWDPGELILLYLSRVHPKKGLHLLITALCTLGDSLPEKWRLVIVGDGDEGYISKCKERLRSNEEVFRRTEWKGAVWGAAKWPFIQGADFFCLPSYSENFGLAVLEACQVGTRVLTTHETPWGFLESFGAAILVQPEVSSVQRGLISCFNGPMWRSEDRRSLSSKVHERFCWQTVGQQYMNLYQQLTGSSITIRDEVVVKK